MEGPSLDVYRNSTQTGSLQGTGSFGFVADYTDPEDPFHFDYGTWVHTNFTPFDDDGDAIADRIEGHLESDELSGTAVFERWLDEHLFGDDFLAASTWIFNHSMVGFGANFLPDLRVASPLHPRNGAPAADQPVCGAVAFPGPGVATFDVDLEYLDWAIQPTDRVEPGGAIRFEWVDGAGHHSVTVPVDATSPLPGGGSITVAVVEDLEYFGVSQGRIAIGVDELRVSAPLRNTFYTVLDAAGAHGPHERC